MQISFKVCLDIENNLHDVRFNGLCSCFVPELTMSFRFHTYCHHLSIGLALDPRARARVYVCVYSHTRAFHCYRHACIPYEARCMCVHACVLYVCAHTHMYTFYSASMPICKL